MIALDLDAKARAAIAANTRHLETAVATERAGPPCRLSTQRDDRPRHAPPPSLASRTVTPTQLHGGTTDLTSALASGWAAIAERHTELPPVLIGIARGSRQGVKRRRHAHFAGAAWTPVRPDGGVALRACSAALDEAVATGDLAALGDLLADSTDLLMREALELSRDAYEIRGEVLFTEDGLAGSPLDVLGLLLHEATHAVATERGVKDASRQGRYHNRHFKAIAEELGLHVMTDPPFGWTSTSVTSATAEHYADTLAILARALSAAPDEGRVGGSPDTVRTLECRCGRRTRAGRSRAPLAVLCTACRQPS